LKILPFKPGRGCENITGEPNLIFTKKAITKHSRNINGKSIKITIKSNNLFIP